MPDAFSLSDLARLADVTPRTVRYYVAQGLLPSPDAAGPATRYPEGHLARLRLIKRLQRDHLPLAEIRARLERMGDDEVLAAAAMLDPQEPEPSLDRRDTLDFVRGLMLRSGVRPSVGGSVAPDEDAGPSAPRSDAAPRLKRLTRPATAMRVLESAPPPASVAPAQSMPATADAAPPMAAPVPSRITTDRSTWERLVISPDVELHVRRPLDRQANKRVDRLERIARELFEDP